MSIYSDDFNKMKWDEFCSLLSGLSERSPLARTVAIRLEEDREILKHFSSSQHKIRSEWRSKLAQSRTPEELDSFLREMQAALSGM